MRDRIFILTLISSAIIALSCVPCTAAELIYNLVYFAGTSGGPRIPHPPSSSSSTGFHTLQSVTAGNISSTANNPFRVPLNARQQLIVGAAPHQSKYVLGYANVSGGVEGGGRAMPNSAGALSSVFMPVFVGTANIVVNYVYFPVGGGPCGTTPCPTGATIGEVGESSGFVLYDFFVTVSVPPSSTADSGLTDQGNYNGSVPTTDNAVQINADAAPLSVNPATNKPGSPTNLIFDRWVSGEGGTIGSDRNLDVAKQTDVYALALYRSPCAQGYQWESTPIISQCVLNPASKCPADCANGCRVEAPGVPPNNTRKPVLVCNPPPLCETVIDCLPANPTQVPPNPTQVPRT
jgi:hypothetical protein